MTQLDILKKYVEDIRDSIEKEESDLFGQTKFNPYDRGILFATHLVLKKIEDLEK